jgi:hypothetical protein
MDGGGQGGSGAKVGEDEGGGGGGRGDGTGGGGRERERSEKNRWKNEPTTMRRTRRLPTEQTYLPWIAAAHARQCDVLDGKLDLVHVLVRPLLVLSQHAGHRSPPRRVVTFVDVVVFAGQV